MSFYHINKETVKRYDDKPEKPLFVPYATNGGTIVAIAGDDYAVIGADTRLTLRQSILSRNQDKLFKLSPTLVLGTCGCWADVLAFSKVLKLRVDMYVYENHKPISAAAAAQLISVNLYYKRFFPYYLHNILAGLDEDGKGCIYNFDSIGHCEKSTFTATGSAGSLLSPLLDNKLANKEAITNQKAVSLLKDGFTCAAEREVNTGDFLQILTMKKGAEMFEERFSLRKD